MTLRKMFVLVMAFLLLSMHVLASPVEAVSSKVGTRTAEEIAYLSQPEVVAAMEKQQMLADLHMKYRLGEITSKEYAAELADEKMDAAYISKATRVEPLTAISERGVVTKVAAAAVENQLWVSGISQQNSYYCGPATAQIILKYKSSSYSKTQGQIATLLGTTSGGTAWYTNTYPMKNTLNSELSSSHYNAYPVSVSTTDAQLKAQIMWAIDLGYPIAGNIYSVTFNGYYTGGHWLVIRGYKNSGDTISIVDPAYGMISEAGAQSLDVSIGTIRYALQERGMIY